MRISAARCFLTCAVALTLAACGPHPKKAKAEPPPAAAVSASGWLDADTADGPGIAFHYDTTAPSFTMRCAKAGKLLRVTTPNPLQDAPTAREEASLQLGATTFQAPVAQVMASNAPQLTMVTAITPQLLIALGDAKTARLAFRDGSSETGVDEDGKIVGFAQRCARVTGVEPAL